MSHLTMRGKVFDYESFKMRNQGVRPVGNGRINVMGDIVDNKGKVLKKQDEIYKEWLERQNDSSHHVRKSNIKTLTDDLLTNQPRVQHNAPEQQPQPKAQVTPTVAEPKGIGKKPRRMVEAD